MTATATHRRAVAEPTSRLRVLLASHGHPKVTVGGAEISAYHLFEALQERPDCQAWFLGCDPSRLVAKQGVAFSQPWSDAEYVYAPESLDWFKFANRDLRLAEETGDLLRQLSPDVVHFHHYINFGVEMFDYVRRVLPSSRIVLSLHEYLALCHHYGQMVTRQHRTLCHESSPERCHKCFPEFSPADFFLRNRYIMRFFGVVDTFIAPSHFLAERYAAWGVPAAKLVVLENYVPPAAPVAPPVFEPDQVLRIGFFGQISALKGINVVFDTAQRLAAEDVSNVSFDIFGDYAGQPQEFQTEFLARLQACGPNVQFNGPYDRSQLDRLIQSVHAVLVPSVWWENSPLVIQEALRNRRPVICSDIGGMAEKVRSGVDGLHFPAGNVMALTNLLRRLARNPEPLARIAAGMTGMPATASTIDDFLSLYRASTTAGTTRVSKPRRA
ncbi:MAG: glycosyltransferase family 4 protein [Proteobacteria bacterium]|nr:glycosyltransferase family 4 protein [Pseudomonadota bacterium]